MIEKVNYLVLAIVLIIFTIASYEDIKKREVYDFLNFGFLFSILIIGVIDSFLTESFIPILLVIVILIMLILIKRKKKR